MSAPRGEESMLSEATAGIDVLPSFEGVSSAAPANLGEVVLRADADSSAVRFNVALPGSTAVATDPDFGATPFRGFAAGAVGAGAESMLKFEGRLSPTARG